MKTLYLRNILFFVLGSTLLVGCVNDEDAAIPPFETIVYSERFEDGSDNQVLATEGWTNVAEAGTALWKTQEFDDNVYAEFSAYQTNEASNVAWLISPPVVLEANNNMFLKFAVSQSFVSSPSNKLEVFLSTDYDGTNVETATWTQVDANIPGPDADYYQFYDSGAIDLSGFSGNVTIGFKYTGSGTNTSLDGSYQIDDVTVYHN